MIHFDPSAKQDCVTSSFISKKEGKGKKYPKNQKSKGGKNPQQITERWGSGWWKQTRTREHSDKLGKGQNVKDLEGCGGEGGSARAWALSNESCTAMLAKITSDERQAKFCFIRPWSWTLNRRQKYLHKCRKCSRFFTLASVCSKIEVFATMDTFRWHSICSWTSSRHWSVLII